MRDETSQPHEAETKKIPNLNNFYCYCPGGMYRMKEYYAVLQPERRKIIQAIDNIIREKNNLLQIKTAVKNMKKAAQTGPKIFELSQEEQSEKAQQLETYRGRLEQEAEIILRPLYEKLLAQGFSHDVLIR